MNSSNIAKLDEIKASLNIAEEQSVDLNLSIKRGSPDATISNDDNLKGNCEISLLLA